MPYDLNKGKGSDAKQNEKKTVYLGLIAFIFCH